MDKRIVSRKGEWFCIVETPDFVREYGPFTTRKEAIEFKNQPISIMHGLTPEQTVLVDGYRDIFQRVNVDDLILAEAVRVLSEAGITQTVMAHHIGRNQTWVSFMFRLAIMPASLLSYRQRNLIGSTALVKTVDKWGPQETERRIRAILANRKYHVEGQSRRITERWSRITEREMMIKLNAASFNAAIRAHVASA